MNVREQIIATITFYKEGKYDIKTFCDIFGSLYYYQTGGYKSFTADEQEILDEIGFITERYTDSVEDLTQYPNTYFSKEQAEKKFSEILAKLKF